MPRGRMRPAVRKGVLRGRALLEQHPPVGSNTSACTARGATRAHAPRASAPRRSRDPVRRQHRTIPRWPCRELKFSSERGNPAANCPQQSGTAGVQYRSHEPMR
jgi:hypothetical protein